jgi:hypothetical protein
MGSSASASPWIKVSDFSGKVVKGDGISSSVVLTLKGIVYFKSDRSLGKLLSWCWPLEVNETFARGMEK